MDWMNGIAKRACAIVLAGMLVFTLVSCAPKEDVRTAFLKGLTASNKNGRYDTLIKVREDNASATLPDSGGMLSQEDITAAYEAYYAPFEALTDEHMFELLQQNAYLVMIDQTAADAGVTITPGEPEYEEVSESDGKTFYSYELPLTLSNGEKNVEITVRGQIATVNEAGKTVVAAFRFDQNNALFAALGEFRG